MQNRWIKRLVGLVWLGLASWGVVGVVQRLTLGHAMAHYGSYVPWGLPVVGYVHFIGLSEGAALLWCAVRAFGIRRLERVGRLSLLLAAVALPMGLVLVWFDLGQMARALEVFTRPRWTSVMTWLVWLYAAYLIWLAAASWCEVRRGRPSGRGGEPMGAAAGDRTGRRVMRAVAGVGFPVVIACSGGIGALFAAMPGKVAWHSGLLPILFLVGAFVSGSALVLAAWTLVADADREGDVGATRLLSRTVLAVLLAYLLLEWAEVSIPIWYGVGAGSEIWHTVLLGDRWWLFWIVHLAAGSVIPLALLAAKPGSRTAAGVAGLLIVVTFFAVRWNCVLPGQMLEPAFPNLAQAYQDHRLRFSYTPSGFEWSLVAFAVAAGLAMFYGGLHVLSAGQPGESDCAADESAARTNG